MAERELQQNTFNSEEEDAYKVKKRTYDLLPNADENIAKLKVRHLILYTCMSIHTCSRKSDCLGYVLDSCLE